MPQAAPFIIAGAAVVGAGASVFGTIFNNVQADRQFRLQSDQLLSDANKSILDLENQNVLNRLARREANANIQGYDRWLDNFNNMHAQTIQTKQAQTNALIANGQETYNSFLDAIGFADAQAGATGRVAAGTSQSHVTSTIDSRLVDFVGGDRTLDAHGGLFGSQLTAANMEMQQLQVDLLAQRDQFIINRDVLKESIPHLNRAIDLTHEGIYRATESRDSLESFVNGILR
jgi:hypothetical protein